MSPRTELPHPAPRELSEPLPRAVTSPGLCFSPRTRSYVLPPRVIMGPKERRREKCTQSSAQDELQWTLVVAVFTPVTNAAAVRV